MRDKQFEFVIIMICLLGALTMLVGCDRSTNPGYLKAHDSAVESCKKDCAPREIDNFSNWDGCHCKVDK